MENGRMELQWKDGIAMKGSREKFEVLMQQLIETCCLFGGSILDLTIGTGATMVVVVGIGRWACDFEEVHDLIHHVKAKLKILKNSGSSDPSLASSTKNLTNDIDKVVPVESARIAL